MARAALLREVTEAFSFVPGFVSEMPDMVLEQWWGTAKNFLMVDTALPMKTKALIGLSASAAVRCRY